MVHPQLTNYFNDIKSKNALFFIRPIFVQPVPALVQLRFLLGPDLHGPQTIFWAGKLVTDRQCLDRTVRDSKLKAGPD